MYVSYLLCQFFKDRRKSTKYFLYSEYADAIAIDFLTRKMHEKVFKSRRSVYPDIVK